MNSKYITILALFSIISFTLAIEKPSYEVVKVLDEKTEIRKYAPSKWVSTSSQSLCSKEDSQKNILFSRLFGYITGQNDKKQKIDMTSPVLTEVKNLDGQNCEFTMSFYIPKDKQLNTPVPTGQASLTQLNEFNVVVTRFGGYAKMNDYLSHKNSLVQRLGNEVNNYDHKNYITAGYNSPFQLLGRTNEVWFRQN